MEYIVQILEGGHNIEQKSDIIYGWSLTLPLSLSSLSLLHSFSNSLGKVNCAPDAPER